MANALATFYGMSGVSVKNITFTNIEFPVLSLPDLTTTTQAFQAVMKPLPPTIRFCTNFPALMKIFLTLPCATWHELVD
jgi:hypothetical protein